MCKCVQGCTYSKVASCPLHLIAFIILSPSEAAGRLRHLPPLPILCRAFARHRRGLLIHTQTHTHIYTRSDVQSRGDLRVRTRWALNLRFVIKLLLERFNHRDLILRGSTSLERKRTQSCRCPLNIHTCTQSISANVKRLRRTQME